MKRALIAGSLLGAALLLTGCSELSNDSARVESPADISPGEVIAMPDGFSNVATKCDGHGNRIYTIFHGAGANWTPFGAVAVLSADPTCKVPAK